MECRATIGKQPSNLHGIASVSGRPTPGRQGSGCRSCHGTPTWSHRQANHHDDALHNLHRDLPVAGDSDRTNRTSYCTA